MIVHLLGDIRVTVETLYCPPRKPAEKSDTSTSNSTSTTKTKKTKKTKSENKRKTRGREGGGLYPELAILGISEGSSPNVQEEVGRLVALLPIEQAREELARRQLTMDEKAVHRVATELGAQMLATRTRDLMRFRVGQLPAGTEFAGKRIAVAIDGGRLRTRTVIKKSRSGKKRKRRKFKVKWREPKLLIIFELDEQGRMEKKTSRPIIDGTLEGPDALMELVAFHLHRTGAAAAQEIVFLGDGAPWIWARLDWVIQRAGLNKDRVWQTLDWCHAAHHLSLALAAQGLSKDSHKTEYNRLKKLLKQGKWQKVLDELEKQSAEQPENKDLARELNYFQKHGEAKRLEYAVAKYRRQPMGSGAIESAVRRVINLRLKGNSMYWEAGNAEAVLQMRSALLSGRWDETVAHTRQAIARNRRTDWRWQPPDELAELKALANQTDELPQRLKYTRPTAIAG